MYVFAHKYLGFHFYTLSLWSKHTCGHMFGCRHMSTHLDMHLPEQEGANETISSDNGRKWCGILGKEHKALSNWRIECSKDDLLLERDFTSMPLWPLHGFTLFLLSLTFFADFISWLSYYLSRHTCGIMVSVVGWALWAHSTTCLLPYLHIMLRLIYLLKWSTYPSPLHVS